MDLTLHLRLSLREVTPPSGLPEEQVASSRHGTCKDAGAESLLRSASTVVYSGNGIFSMAGRSPSRIAVSSISR